MKIGVIGDLHLKDHLPYYEFIKDKRESEEKEVLLCIIEWLSECDKIVILGDQLNGKNNSSETIKKFVTFIESFGSKDIYIISGNHEIKTDKLSAIDFMKEVNKPNWHIISSTLYQVVDGMLFVPYCKKQFLPINNEDNKKSSEFLLKLLPESPMAFFHQSISGFKSTNEQTVDIFDEMILSFEEISSKYKLVFSGHIHKPQHIKNIYYAGSVFNCEVGDHGKSIWIINDDMSVKEIKLPGRNIYKIENEELLKDMPPNSIVKYIVTDKNTNIEELKDKYENFFDSFIIVEQYKNERKKLKEDIKLIDFSMNNLISLYAKEKGIDEKEIISCIKKLEDE